MPVTVRSMRADAWHATLNDEGTIHVHTGDAWTAETQTRKADGLARRLARAAHGSRARVRFRWQDGRSRFYRVTLTDD